MAKLSTFKGFGATSGSSGGSSGGSSSSGYTKRDYKVFGGDSGWNNSSTYSFASRTAGGRKNNKFFTIRGEYNGTAGQTRARVTAFEVNTTTGAISLLAENNSWLNTSGSGWSTTYFNSPEGTGAYWAGGNNAYPGQSSHYFGYFYGKVNENGSLSATGYNASNADHGYNGNYNVPPTGTNTGYVISGGYSGSDSRARWRTSEWDGTSWTTGSENNPNSNTSTTYGLIMVASPTYTASGNDFVGAVQYRDSVGNDKLRVVAANGSTSEHSLPNRDSNAIGFQLDDGTVIVYGTFGTYKFTAYNSKSTLNATYPYPINYIVHGFGVGGNKFVLPMNTSSAGATNMPMLLCSIDATGTVTDIEWGPVASPQDGFFPVSSSYTRAFAVWDSASATTPTHLVFIANQGYAQTRVLTTDWPFTTSL